MALKEAKFKRVVPQEALDALSLPMLRENRYLITEAYGFDLSVSVLALPPIDPSASKFWARTSRKWSELTQGKPEPIPSARLEMRPPIAYDQFQRGDHTPISGQFPYVVMEDGTRYALRVLIPTKMVGSWSELQERASTESEGYLKVFSTDRETFRERQNVALLITLNGNAPLGEIVRNMGGNSQSIRREMLMGIDGAPTVNIEGTEYHSAIAASRHVVNEGRNAGSAQLGEQSQEKAQVSDLVFRTVTERGSGENATFDERGLVEVVVCRVVDDEVIERIAKPLKIDLGSHRQDLFPDFERRRMELLDSTVKGKTSFENERRTKVNIQTVRSVSPLARFRFALVASGGPITAQMSEAPQSA